MPGRWEYHTEGPGARHVWPIDDIRAHDLVEPGDGPGCWCLPEWTMVATNDGNVTMLVKYRSLDGREQQEREPSRFHKIRNFALRLFMPKPPQPKGATMDNIEFSTAEECKAFITEKVAGHASKFDVESIYLTVFGFDASTQKFHLTIGEDGFWAAVSAYEK